MKQSSDMVLDSGDLASFLMSLASQLRHDGLALTGMAYEQFKVDDKDFRLLTELSAALERKAEYLEKIQWHLCQTCRMVQVTSKVGFGKPST